ncbi:MAG: hypothetical protein WBL27_08145 [Salinimicrobium sp.]
MSETEKKYKAEPQRLPEPTYWPFMLALGIVVLLWGILTNIIVSMVGFVVFIIALAGWLKDLYKEVKTKEDEL